jgi:hypothetical protein
MLLLPALAAATALAAPPATAQRVALEVRPHPGDTLHVTLEHIYTLSGGPRNFPDSASTVNWTYHVVTRDVVERTDPGGTIIQAIVDSVRMSTTGSIGASPFPGIDRGMEGLRVRLQIAPDGGSKIIEGLAQLDSALRDVLGVMPSVLPLKPVVVGEVWTRDLPLPAEGAPGASAPSGMLRATFRLDSLTDDGDHAWISLHGRVDAAPRGKPGEGAAMTQMSGTLSGVLLLDRRRGWLAESRATVNVESLVTLPGVGEPLLVRVRVDQVMRTAPARR